MHMGMRLLQYILMRLSCHLVILLNVHRILLSMLWPRVWAKYKVPCEVNILERDPNTLFCHGLSEIISSINCHVICSCA